VTKPTPELTRLDNGLAVVAWPKPGAALTAVHLRVETGSGDEQADEHGGAHFLEHMLFKGTGRRGVGAVAAEIEGLGGDLNAYTSVDQTVLHATVDGPCWEQALDVLADMATSSTLDPAETRKEREVILEEIRSYADDPADVAAERANAALFPDHPYGRPVLGTMASVSAMDERQLGRFWRREWSAGRASVAVVGDVDPKHVADAVARRLGGWSRGDAPARHVAPSAPQPGWYTIEGDFDTPVLELAWRIPERDHPDVPALLVLCALLGQNDASMLSLVLQHEKRLAVDVWSETSLLRAAGALSIGLYPHPKKTADGVAAALDVVRAVARNPRPADVRRARDGLLADALYAEETVEGLAEEALHHVAVSGDLRGRQKERAALAEVDVDAVRRVATWLDPDRAIVATTELPPRYRRKKAVEASSGPVERVVRADGLTVVLLPDGGPIASIHAVGLGGGLAVPDDLAGLPLAWASTAGEGAGAHDARSLRRATDALSGSVSAIPGRNTVDVGATFPAEKFRDGLDLWGAVLTEPRFDAGEWERVREDLVEDARTRNDRASEVLGDATWAALYPGHPWRHPRGGTPATLHRITPDDLRGWHRRLFRTENLVVAVSGGFDPDEVLGAITPWLDRLPTGPADLPPRPAPGSPARRGVRIKAGNEQAWLQFGAPGRTLTDPDRAAFDLVAAVLGGQGGRLFLALREERGLAYSVWAQHQPGWDGGLFAAGLATSPTRADEAHRALRNELERFAESPPDDAELQRYRRSLVGAAAASSERASGRALEAALCERYGLPRGVEAQRAALAAVGPDEVRAVARALLDGPSVPQTPNPMIIIIIKASKYNKFNFQYI
jgi:zinc protease